jgi:hypothetical protein
MPPEERGRTAAVGRGSATPCREHALDCITERFPWDHSPSARNTKEKGGRSAVDGKGSLSGTENASALELSHN